MAVIATGPGIACPRPFGANLIPPRGDVKKGHAINRLSLFRDPFFAYNYCKEGLDKKLSISIFYRTRWLD